MNNTPNSPCPEGQYFGAVDFTFAKQYCPQLPIRPQPSGPPVRIYGSKYGPKKHEPATTL